jgi:2-polyprenyl-3-methyl-5-hydroxy-6-metoxy-1,4-benzoquinol methylase
MHPKEENIDELLKREEEFHDEWAMSEDVNDIDVYALFDSFVAQENAYVLEQLGDLKGKRILDVGAGLGESSVYFALKGADVYFNDISPKMGEFAEKLAEKHGVKLNFLIAPIERLELHRNFFDIIYCANLMHHVPPEDQESWIKTMSESLKAEGTLVTIDPLKYNPAINVYREKAEKVRTIDEQPLGFDILDIYKKYFKKVHHKEFWLTTLWLFISYYFIRRYNPNEIRYWKKIFKEKPSRIGWWFNPLKAIDRMLLSLPGIKKMAWNIVIIARK